MAYITLADIDDLPPDDPERAFVIYEDKVRTRYEQDLRGSESFEYLLELKHAYMCAVLPAAEHLGISQILFFSRPTTRDKSELNDLYDEFIRSVDWALSDIKLKIYKRERPASVVLDARAKLKLRGQLNSIRTDVEKLILTPEKRGALLRCIDELLAELENDQITYGRFGAIVIRACKIAGEGATIMDPVWRAVERMGAAIGLAKERAEKQAQLPPPSPPKRIESSKKHDKLDDEIPF